VLKFLQRLFGAKDGASRDLQPSLQRKKRDRGPKAVWGKKNKTESDNGHADAIAAAVAEVVAEALPDSAEAKTGKSKKTKKTKAKRSRRKKRKGGDDAAEDSSVVRDAESSGAIVATPVTANPVHPFRITESKKTPNIKTCTFDPISFDILSSWMVEYVPDLEGTLIFCTDFQAAWQANLFVQYREDPNEQSLEQTLDTLVKELATQKETYAVNRNQVREHRNHFSFGIIEGTCNKDGILLVEWEIIIPCYANVMLRISTSSAYEDWNRNRNFFKGTLDSIRAGA
jgi:hypothetical protein